MTLTEAFATFDSDKWSEADTRSKYIDYVLIDTCGISEGSIRREVHNANSGKRCYLDYLVEVSGVRAVVEAKRSTVALLENTKAHHGYRTLGKLLEENPDLKEHVAQVRNYAMNMGAIYCILTNGRQWILFRTFRDNVEVGDLQAVLIHNLVSGDKNFGLAWLQKVLSPEGLKNKELDQELFGHRYAPATAALITEIDNEPVEPRELERVLTTWLPRYLTDAGLQMRGNLLEKSWVSPIQASTRDQSIAVDYSSGKPSATTLRDKHGFDRFIESINELSSGSGASAHVIPLIGEGGSGKTHFLRMAMRQDTDGIVVDEQFRWDDSLGTKRHLWVYCDLRTATNKSKSEIEDHILGMILELLHKVDGRKINEHEVAISNWEAYASLFHAQFSKFKRPEWRHVQENDQAAFAKAVDETIELCMKDRPRFLAAVLRFLRDRHKLSIRLAIDNADQLDEDVQANVYLFGQSVASQSSVAVIVVLRAGWYNRHKDEGVTSAFSDFVYALPPVPVVDVLARRVELLLNDMTEARETQNVGFVFMQILSRALSSEHDVKVLFEGLSNGLARVGMGYLSKAIRSAHMNLADLKKMIGKSTDRFHLYVHQLLPAMVGGRNTFYDFDEFPIPNVFSVSGTRGVDHWFRLQVLDALGKYFEARKTTQRHGFIGRGLFLGSIANAVMQAEGYANQLLCEMEKDRLVEFDVKRFGDETPQQSSKQTQILADGWRQVRITIRGRYLFRIAGTVTYSSCMLPLIPFKAGASLRTELKDALLSFAEHVPLGQRLKLVEKFADYLEEDSIKIPGPNASLESDGFIVASPHEIGKRVAGELRTDIARIRASR